MATAILDIELTELPPGLSGLNRYSGALVLIRFRGKPVGQAYLPLSNGEIAALALRDLLIEAAGHQLWQAVFHDWLEQDDPQTTDEPPPKASIAICTRDRTDDLKRCLDSLMRLREDGQEILVIDNCPATEATRQLVQNYASVRYVRENQPGLNNARNRAIHEARNEIVAFIDDDAVADPNWSRELVRNFNNPMVACVTGLTMPIELETEAQEWFERHCPFNRGFRRKTFKGDSHNPMATGQIGAGVNMALRRRSMLEIGLFDPALDAGTPTQSGGDHEIFSRLLISGYSITYDPAALSWHRHRRTWEELRRALHGYGVGVYALLVRSLFVEREWSAVKIAWGWFRYDQFPALVRALRRRPGSKPLDLILAELRGCVMGPRAYFKSRKRLAVRS
jgi:glycosyltransferase involved in cell wall biosynthesis